MSIIGIIINIFMIYLKGFIIGFSLSSFFLVYKYKGLLAALIYAFPTSIINILVCLLLGVYSVLFTINLWKIIFLKEKDFNMKRFIKKYFLVLIICIILIIISSLTEGFLVPSLLKLVIKLFEYAKLYNNSIKKHYIKDSSSFPKNKTIYGRSHFHNTIFHQ